MEKIKVLGYCRVSSEKQKLKDNSVKNQIQFSNDYCNEVIDFYNHMDKAGYTISEGKKDKLNKDSNSFWLSNSIRTKPNLQNNFLT